VSRHDEALPAVIAGVLSRAPSDIRAEVDALLKGFKLQRIRRYMGQPYWDDESSAARYADMADAALLLAWRFPFINAAHAARLAIVHDKMELAVGDLNPVGRDGTGHRAHAFDESRRTSKDDRERRAILDFLDRLPPSGAKTYGPLLFEALECQSPESRYVKAIDKMNALAFILLKKRGSVSNKHLTFLLEFTAKNNGYFPGLAAHSNELLRRILSAAASIQEMSVAKLLAVVGPRFDTQLSLLDNLENVHAASPTPLEKTKRQRLDEVFADLAQLSPARTGVEAWAQLSAAVNRVEDQVWGTYWQPPRFVPPGTSTERMYPIAPDSVYPVEGWLVDVLVAEAELIFVSMRGAIEIQEKDRGDLLGVNRSFPDRAASILFEKRDSRNRSVWDPENRSSVP
jgi:5'-deoxynucleotidase YfbR-like HD superfamily hydrolase